MNCGDKLYFKNYNNFNNQVSNLEVWNYLQSNIDQ